MILEQTLVRSGRKDTLQTLLVSDFVGVLSRGEISVGNFRFYAAPNLKSFAGEVIALGNSFVKLEFEN